MERDEWLQMKESLKLIEGKWIDVMSFGGVVPHTPMYSVQDMQNFLTTPWIMLRSQQGADRYAGMDPRACVTLPDTLTVSGCLMMRKEGREASQ
jgi:hypothetical protein